MSSQILIIHIATGELTETYVTDDNRVMPDRILLIPVGIRLLRMTTWFVYEEMCSSALENRI